MYKVVGWMYKVVEWTLKGPSIVVLWQGGFIYIRSFASIINPIAKFLRPMCDRCATNGVLWTTSCCVSSATYDNHRATLLRSSNVLLPEVGADSSRNFQKILSVPLLCDLSASNSRNEKLLKSWRPYKDPKVLCTTCEQPLPTILHSLSIQRRPSQI